MPRRYDAAFEPISHAIRLGGDAERATHQGGERPIRRWLLRRPAHRPQSRDPVPGGSDSRIRQLTRAWMHLGGGVVEPVTGVNRAPRKPAEAATQVGRSATEHDRHVESAGHGHVRPSPGLAFTDIDRRSGGGLEQEWRSHVLTVDRDRARRSGDRHPRADLAFEQRADDRDLEDRSAVGISERDVGEAM